MERQEKGRNDQTCAHSVNISDSFFVPCPCKNNIWCILTFHIFLHPSGALIDCFFLGVVV